MKTIYLEPAWKLPLSYRELLAHPPRGYRFTAPRTRFDPAIRRAAGNGRVYSLRHAIQEAGLPVNLLKSLAGCLRPPPPGTDLTYADNHLVLRREPWLLDLECELPAILVGPERRFLWYRRLVEKALLSPWCRKIITRVEAGRQALLSTFDGRLAGKVEVVYWAATPKSFEKGPPREMVRLLFVNSANLPGQFQLKGGKEAVEAFLLLRQRHPNVELTVRSDLPASLRRRYQGIPGLRLLPDALPWEQLEAEFQTADIFVLPSHVTPGNVFLDAMSYELPVVTTDVWGNAEMVEDGRTGFLVAKSTLAPDFLPGRAYGRTWEFERVVRNVDRRMVEALVHKLSALIEDEGLRRRMGRAARREIEEGRFSIARRNERLGQVLAEATKTDGTSSR